MDDVGFWCISWTKKNKNVVFKVMTPEIGVPFVTEQTMVLSTSKKQALAKEFN